MTQTITFNSQSYGQYTNTSLVRMLGNMAGQAVTLVGVFDGRWFNADPLMALAGTATIDRWLFTGFVFRLSVVLCSLVLLFRRRFVAAAFAYLFPITLFVRTDEGFHAMPFVVVALVLGWGLVTGEWLKTEPDFAPTPPASRRAGCVQSVLRVGQRGRPSRGRRSVSLVDSARGCAVSWRSAGRYLCRQFRES